MLRLEDFMEIAEVASRRGERERDRAETGRGPEDGAQVSEAGLHASTSASRRAGRSIRTGRICAIDGSGACVMRASCLWSCSSAVRRWSDPGEEGGVCVAERGPSRKAPSSVERDRMICTEVPCVVLSGPSADEADQPRVNLQM
jgi:hypothetical protein